METAATSPSCFDVQVNGYAGVDFQSDTLSAVDLLHAVNALRSAGVSRFFPTLITDDTARLEEKFRRLESFRAADPLLAESIVGYHLEGPYISPLEGFRGAHPGHAVKAPDIAEFLALFRASGQRIRLLTLAPEWPGSPAFITELVAMGIAVSLGHTNAGEQEIDQAIAAGARFCTHLGNGVPTQLHRHDNVIQRLLARDELIAFFIPDGIHLPPPALRNFVRAKPPGKAFFTTDAMAAAGAPPGTYSLGPHRLQVGPDRVVREPGRENFAGSTLDPASLIHNVRAWLGLDEAAAQWMYGQGIADLFHLQLPTR